MKNTRTMLMLTCFSWKNLSLIKKRGVFLITLVMIGAISAQGQTPGGVPRHLTSWFKANTSVPGNIAVTSAAENKVTEWKSDVGDASVSQPGDSYRPVYQPAVSAIAKFNFNPLIQFNADNGTSLYNGSSGSDLLGTAGTIFLVSNQHAGSFFGPTGFTYYFTDAYRYQMKPSLVLQTGSNYLGWAAGLNSSAAVVNPAPDESAFILVSRSNESDFRARKNADSIPIVHNGSNEVFPSVSPGIYMGNDGTGGVGQPFNGGIGEVITFDTALSSSDVNKVESYLAIKYGITISQSSAYGADNSNYTASDGTQIWSAAANSTYQYNITGIGRDDASVLLQKQSRSIQNNALVYLYNGSVSGSFPAMNTDNTSEINSDKSFLMVGDDGATNEFTRCLSQTLVTAMGRTWKVQKTGSGVTPITIAVDASEVSPSIKSLVVSADPAFGSGNTFYPLSISPDGKLYASVTLNSNEYFTFGTDTLKVALTPASPACTDPNSGSVAASVTGGAQPYAYSWSPSAQTTATLTGVAAGTYTLSLTHGACVHTETVTIQPAVIPAAPQAASVAACTGTTATLSVSNAETGATYNWYADATGGTALATGSSFTTPAITANTVFYVEGVSSQGCTGARTAVPVTVSAALQTPAAASVGICPGSTATVLVQNPQTAVTYTWYADATGGTALATGASFTTPAIATATSYYVEASNSGGCVSSRGAAAVTLNAKLAQPDVTFTSATSTSITFSWSAVTGAASYQVSVNGGAAQTPSSGSTGLTHTVSGLAPATSVTIAVTALGTESCEISEADTASGKTPGLEGIFIPNVFTPNGDGRNDLFKVYGNTIASATMQVFNQWGEMIYQTNDAVQGWNGVSKNAQQPVGVYIYVIKVKLTTGENLTRKGSFNLVR